MNSINFFRKRIGDNKYAGEVVSDLEGDSSPSGNDSLGMRAE